ncbi:MAG: hypothetical protein KatS3mg002_1608 [Candidatus Woesearchaeota archaeon]|nr:MAG: hypothetical protein KatS3mg002_1608 [Candidatus Woesearchaeota archaeon]
MPRKKTEKKEEKKKNSSKTKTIFIEILPDKYFILCDGRTIKDYRELAAILETISDDVFYYHVSSERNDFANWIRDVFGEEELADKIRNSKSRHEMIAILYKHLFEKLSSLIK